MHTIRHYDDPAAYPHIKNGEVIEHPTEAEPYHYLEKSASATDMTGLITHGPVTDSVLASYMDLYPFLPPIPGDEEDII